MPGKREDYLNWEEFFILMCLIARERSKDPKTQVGAAIIKDHKVLSIGYNGTPKGMSDEEMPWDSKGEETGDIFQIKNSFVVHAEANALDNLPIGTDLEGATLYVSLSPCPECAKRIAGSGIKKVVYFNEYKNPELVRLSNRLLELAHVACVASNTENLSSKLHELADKIAAEEKRRQPKILYRKKI